MKAKGRPPNGVLARSFKGNIQIRQTLDGRFIAQKWPKKSGPPKTAINKLNTSTFTTLTQMMKTAVAEDIAEAVRVTKGTSLMWRDVLMSTYTGSLWEFRLGDGTILYGAGRVSQTVQGLLDSISNVPGSILGRTATGWQALTPATAGWVLTTQGPSNPPVWAPPSGGGGGGSGAITKIGSGTFTNEASVLINNLSSVQYDYEISLTATCSSHNQEWVRFQICDGSTPPNPQTSGYYSYAVGLSGWTDQNVTAARFASIGQGETTLLNAAIGFSDNNTRMLAQFANASGLMFGAATCTPTLSTGAITIFADSGTLTGSYELYQKQRA